MKRVSGNKLIVFTDLDGTLLDHESYSFGDALPALERLKRNDVPIIITTSKTWAEVETLQRALGLTDPCVVENGSAIFMPNDPFDQGQVKVFGKDYQTICTVKATLPPALRQHIKGFEDMTLEEVSEATGLESRAAAMAQDRMASEPFLWSGSNAELQALAEELDDVDLRLQQGGRFYHMLAKVDKTTGLEWLLQQYQHQNPKAQFTTCALGDGPNDIQMIGYADVGVVMPNPHGVALDIAIDDQGTRLAPAPGPAGWNAALNRLMDELTLSP